MRKKKANIALLEKHIEMNDKKLEQDSAGLDPEKEQDRFRMYLLKNEYDARSALIYAVGIYNGIRMKKADEFFPKEVSETGRKLFAHYIFRDLLKQEELHEQSEN